MCVYVYAVCVSVRACVHVRACVRVCCQVIMSCFSTPEGISSQIEGFRILQT